MTTHNISTLNRMPAATLSSLLLSSVPSSTNTTAVDTDVPTPLSRSIPPAPDHVAIIDVRDADHIGGHIRHSTHVPSSTLDHAIPSLVHKLKHKKIVVFHCALSQQRGPGAALRYLRERERLLGSSKSLGGVSQALKQSREEREGREKGGGDDAEWEDVQQGNDEEYQRVFVLDRGFVGWQEAYGEDERLTEGYRKEIWKDGYWM